MALTVDEGSALSVSGPEGVAGRREAAAGGAGDASVGELLAGISRDLSVLMRQELDLAKAELKEEVTKAGKGAGMMGGAGFAGYMVLLFLSVAAWWALAHAIDTAWAAVIVAIIWAAIGAALFVQGRSLLRRVQAKPQRTAQTVQQIPGALKGE